jgi:hypothetical protein
MRTKVLVEIAQISFANACPQGMAQAKGPLTEG